MSITNRLSIFQAIVSEPELTRMLPLIDNIAIIEYDSSDISCCMAIAQYLHANGLSSSIIRRIVLLGAKSASTIANKKTLSVCFPDAEITIVRKHWYEADPLKLKVINTLVFHSGHSAGVSSTAFDQETGIGEAFVDFVNKTRIAYFACLLDNTAATENKSRYIFKANLRLREFAFDTDSENSQPTKFCRDKQEYISDCIKILSKKDALIQCIDEADHGCEECNQCDNYNIIKHCPFAQRRVAEFYRKGIYVPQNDQIAHQWERMAARQKYKSACIQVADDLMEGHGCTKSIESALEIYVNYASQVGNDHCIRQIISITDQYESINKMIAIPYIARQAQDGNEEMIIKIFDAFQNGDYGLPNDPIQQKEWIQQGAENGNPRFVKSMFSLLEQENKWDEAYEWYKQLRDVAPEMFDEKKFEEIEMLMLTDGETLDNVVIKGKNYLFGYFGEERDFNLAYKCLKFGSENGHAIAQGLLAIMYLNGWHVRRNFKTAISMLTKAANKDDLWSIYKLSELYNDSDNSYRTGAKWGKILPDKTEEGITNNLPLAFYLKGHCQFSGFLYAVNKVGAFENMLKAATLNIPVAQYELSEMYADKTCHFHDLSQSDFWLRKAAENGYYIAEGKYGIKLFNTGDTFNKKESFNFLKHAYEKGFDDAYWCLAQCYMEGLGTPENKDLAYPLYKRAAEEGILQAQEELCVKHFRGDGPIPENYELCAKWGEEAIRQGSRLIRFETAYASSKLGNHERAKELYLELCNEGDPVAMNNYACELSDPEEKAKWFQKAADKGDYYGMGNLGKLYIYGRGVEQDIEKGIKLLTQSANQGHTGAMMILASLYIDGDKIKQDGAIAVSWYEKAAAQNEQRALIALAKIYNKGSLIPQDTNKAVQYLRQAAENGETEALVLLGEMYEYNSEIQNIHKAIYWYRKAAKKGDSNAKINLKRLNTNWINDNNELENTID